MDLTAFRATLADSAPPAGVRPCLHALWHAANDGWDEAHNIAQAEPGEEGYWIHAYLHRVEGDLGNAGYWYRQAGKPTATGPLEQEWDAIASALLAGDA